MDETSGQILETMEMVPIGKIEDVAKKEFREQRNQRAGKSHERRVWNGEKNGAYAGNNHPRNQGYGSSNQDSQFDRHDQAVDSRDQNHSGNGRGGQKGDRHTQASNEHSGSRWQHDRYHQSDLGGQRTENRQ